LALLLIASKTFAKDNIIYAGLNGLGATVSYERFITKKFSLVPEINAAYFSGVLSTELLGEVRARYYPFSGSFFVDFGLGYGLLLQMYYPYPAQGILASPGVGWKIDIGKPDGFIFNIGLCSDWVWGFNKTFSQVGATVAIEQPNIQSSFIAIKLLFGYAF
jgi:hypothetical protein